LHHPPAFAARQALLLHGTERASLTRTAPPAAAARTTATGWRSTARGTTRRGGAPGAASGRWRGFTATRATTNAKGYSRRPSLAPPAGPGGTPGRAKPAWTGRLGASVRRGCGGTRRRRERCRRGKGRRRRPGACPPPVVPLLILPEPPTLRAESPREWVGRMSAVPCCHDAGRWGSCGSTGGGAAGGFLCTALNVYLYRAYSTGRVPISAELSQLHIYMCVGCLTARGACMAGEPRPLRARGPTDDTLPIGGTPQRLAGRCGLRRRVRRAAGAGARAL
jgi:hypothetical protein